MSTVPTLDDCLTATAQACRLPKFFIMGQRRGNKPIWRARKVYAWLAKTVTDSSWWDIAIAQGKDASTHTACMAAHERAQELIRLDPAFKRDCMEAMRYLFARHQLPRRALKWIDASLEAMSEAAA